MNKFIGYCLTALSLAMLASTAQASFISVQPIQICNDAGANCATTGFFEAETDKIWAQAGIDVNFLAMNTINETDWLDVNVGPSSNTVIAQEGRDVMTAGEAINNGGVTQIINMFFVDALNGSNTFYGLGCGGAIFSTYCNNQIGVFIAGGVFSFNGGIGRLDTIAHELGHVLELTHNTAANELMATGGSRTVPGSINDITPNGALLSLLRSDQITTALGSDFVMPGAAPVPEPSSLAITLLGFALMIALVVRRRSPIA